MIVTGKGMSSQPSWGVSALSVPREQHWFILASTGESDSGCWPELREMMVIMTEAWRIVGSIMLMMFTQHQHHSCTGLQATDCSLLVNALIGS